MHAAFLKCPNKTNLPVQEEEPQNQQFWASTSMLMSTTSRCVHLYIILNIECVLNHF